MEEYKDHLKGVLDRRVKWVTERADKIKRRYIDKLEQGVHLEQYDRYWLEQQIPKGGAGLDIACGDFVIGDDTAGVDGDRKMLGMDYFSEGDELSFQEPEKLDYIVTNYLEAFPSALKVLNEWWRCLKPEGILAIVCRDADEYTSDKGPLDNGRRQTLYNDKILSMYLYRAGFRVVKVAKNRDNKTLRARAIK